MRALASAILAMTFLLLDSPVSVGNTLGNGSACGVKAGATLQGELDKILEEYVGGDRTPQKQLAKIELQKTQAATPHGPAYEKTQAATPQGPAYEKTQAATPQGPAYEKTQAAMSNDVAHAPTQAGSTPQGLPYEKTQSPHLVDTAREGGSVTAAKPLRGPEISVKTEGPATELSDFFATAQDKAQLREQINEEIYGAVKKKRIREETNPKINLRDAANDEIYGKANQQLAAKRAAKRASQRKENAESLKLFLEVSKHEPGTPPMSPAARHKVIEQLESSIQSLSQEGRELTEAQIQLINEAKIRLEILKHADAPVEVVDFVHLKDKPTQHRVYRFMPDEPRTIETRTVAVKPDFVETYDPHAKVERVVVRGPDQVEYFGFELATPELGSAKDVHFLGYPGSVEFPAPKGRYKAVGLDKPFHAPPPLPVAEYEIGAGSPAHRLAAILEPGESATLIGQGGGSAVYVTHPPMPQNIRKADSAAQIKWATENRYRLLKVALDGKNLEHVVRRDHAMLDFSRQLATRVTYDDKPFIRVIERKAVGKDAISEEVLLKDRLSAMNIQHYLNYYYSEACNAACKSGVKEFFKTKNLLEPDEMANRCGALSQALRDSYLPGLRYSRANHLFTIGNYAKDGESGLEVASDLNHGQNHFWNPDLQLWDEFDR